MQRKKSELLINKMRDNHSNEINVSSPAASNGGVNVVGVTQGSSVQVFCTPPATGTNSSPNPDRPPDDSSVHSRSVVNFTVNISVRITIIVVVVIILAVVLKVIF